MTAQDAFFAIYTLEKTSQRLRKSLVWDLHATANDQLKAVSHARMLALQSQVAEVHVKHMQACPESGEMAVKTVLTCRRGSTLCALLWASFTVIALSVPVLLAFL